MITHGTVSVYPTSGGVDIHYRLLFTQAFWIVTVMVVGFFGPFVLSSDNLTWPEGTVILAGMWLWLYGGPLALTSMRFPRWLRAAVNREWAESAHPKTLFGSRSLARVVYRRRSE